MIEKIIIGVFFLGAVYFVGRRLFSSFFPSKQGGCAKGCGCDTSEKSVSAR